MKRRHFTLQAAAAFLPALLGAGTGGAARGGGGAGLCGRCHPGAGAYFLTPSPPTLSSPFSLAMLFSPNPLTFLRSSTLLKEPFLLR